MNRRGFLATVPSLLLAGCAARLGIADRVEVAEKAIRLYPRGDDEPADVAVRRYDPADGPFYLELHDDLEIDPDEPLVISDSLAEKLEAHFEGVEYRISVCEPGSDDCRLTTVARLDFNEVEVGDIIDLVSRSSGARLVEVHERRADRD
ncbi:hypothetical protein [Haloterrigena alkaliphila]|uniref:Lipoprotein n=1 Tax=Haloterrigena alkaliphila TaxID=2816475 RepID=A0A8A2VHZ5_9EURY|nr:hypothetical protein [Haloterrigena alkaliphila]QSX00341.1 hypothetical protein J0X25_05080 [Haloterrigena alkaliphila]